jgi:gluconokinase
MLSVDPLSSSRYTSSHSALSAMPSFQQPRLLHKHLFIVTGPAGCGKTTVAKHLAAVFDMPYLEGDDVRFSSPIPTPRADGTHSFIHGQTWRRWPTARR